MVHTRTRPGSKDFLRLAASARTDVTFVQVARAAQFQDGRLVLEDLDPTTVCLARGPDERFGHMATGTFLDLWWVADSGLSGSALRAVLGRAGPDVQLLGDAVLRLRAPQISGSGLQYRADLLNGRWPGPRAPACSSSAPATVTTTPVRGWARRCRRNAPRASGCGSPYGREAAGAQRCRGRSQSRPWHR